MSLAQHVTQGEGFDYQSPRPDDAEGVGNIHNNTLETYHQTPNDDKPAEWQCMSFAPADLALQDQQHTAAYKVSNLRKGAQVTTAVLACWLASGIVFGFAAFKSILVAEGVYYDLCDDQAESAKSLSTGVDDHTPCDKQDMRLNLIFVIASITTNISCLLAGLALDRFGRRACWIASCLFIAIGSLLIGQSFLIPGFDGYVAGNMLLGLGGTFLFVPSFQLANTFPKHSGLVVAIITGAFDASSSVFLFYRIAYEASDSSLSPEIFFFSYIVVPILILVAEVSIMPSHIYHTMAQLEAKIEKASDQTRDIYVSDGDISDSNELIRVRSARSDRRKAKLDKLEETAGNAEYREARIRAEEERQETSGVWGVLYGITSDASDELFIATIGSQYRYMLGSEEASAINHFFNAALPMGGVLSTPLIGLVLNNLSVPIIFGFLTGFTVAIGVFNCVPSI
ncbi:unnamed protein product [Clonostachys chloroleuca]|uniref:Uncharacterized protein n=1 Tax=Clonostachys chloroleuca TaxID=1926264 RepID=A0AA35M623_9HYPO|nr:unnamed protein product [Clonostachys chloroleuca]